jgi:hypothetical protein
MSNKYVDRSGNPQTSSTLLRRSVVSAAIRTRGKRLRCVGTHDNGQWCMRENRLAVGLQFISAWDPGLHVMLADTDTDASNVVTAAQAGTQWSYRLLP